MATPQEKARIREALHNIPSPTIVELGAHCGEDEDWIRASCFTAPGRYVMVEPDPRNAQEILNVTGRKPLDAYRRLIIGAVSDRNGIADFHFCQNERERNRASGSLRKPTGHLEHFPWIEFPFVGKVQTYTLDSIFEREWLTRIDLLWTDIQGAERDMIRGGLTALRHTRHLFMEAETVELYEGEALKPELIATLQGMGWTLLDDFNYNLLFRNEQFTERRAR